jgi:hypothetical protein
MELKRAPSQVQAGTCDTSKKQFRHHFHALAGRANGHNDCKIELNKHEKGILVRKKEIFEGLKSRNRRNK